MVAAITAFPVQVNNKWHRDRAAAQGGADSGIDGGAPSESAARSLLPPEISPSSEGFNPELYLATFHAVRVVLAGYHLPVQTYYFSKRGKLNPYLCLMPMFVCTSFHLSDPVCPPPALIIIPTYPLIPPYQDTT